MSGARIFIGIGTNLGDREANCVRALLHVSSFASVVKVSPLFETEPVGVEDEQPFFMNAVAELEGAPAPEDLLMKLQEVERAMGRREKGNNRPRIIDLDILFYGGEVIESGGLRIPHPLARERRFILEPLALIAPGFTHPETGETVAEMLAGVKDNFRVEMKESRFFPHPGVENCP
ncbi:MAG: 2-amino-4-hydroxy-6-hydroxymethyldihydropteridine diphosphokinase [Candidatus Dadabacteria bacterium]|nr:2-amino-4-hydroxy-6-hydroxymethyldihydropteridine diphosphokinase [Candidatus Dadabacteria bacterium]